MKISRVSLFQAFGLIAIALVFSLLRQATAPSAAPQTASKSPTQAAAVELVDSNAPIITKSTQSLAKTHKLSDKERRQSAKQQALQALPKTEQESLWSAFAAARRAVLPLTDYEATLPHNKGVHYFAQNPGQELTARFLDGTTRIESGRGGKWAATLGLAGAAKTKPVLTKERVEYHHANGITEWYENRAEGIEHAFTVSRRPDEASPELRLALTLQGVEARPGKGKQSGAIIFADPATGAAVLSYGTLKVWDAAGRELAARYEVREQKLDIVVADAGAVYPVTIDPLIATQEAKLGPEVTGDGREDDSFGYSVALEGDTALVGAASFGTESSSNSGSVYVFKRSGSVWTLQARLVPNIPQAGDEFGTAVALSGNTILVGAHGILYGSSSVYVFIRSGSVWSQQAKLPTNNIPIPGAFGWSVALSGNTALIGAPNAYSEQGEYTGCAYVFVRSGTVWSQQAKLTASDASSESFFGYSVAVSGDTVLIGAAKPTGRYSGGVYVFKRSGTVWNQEAKLTDDGISEVTGFGRSVALEGDTALVGACYEPYEDGTSSQGYAYVFTRNNFTWTQQARLSSSNGITGNRFGCSVALSGDKAIIGELHTQTPTSTPTSSAYVFARSGSDWTQKQQFSYTSAEVHEFGYAVAISGDTVLVGMPRKYTPAGLQAGQAQVFKLTGETWGLEATLDAGDAAVGDYFARSVAFEGEIAVLGAPYDDTASGVNSGSAYVLKRSGISWSQQARLYPSDGAEGDEFGNALAIAGNAIVVGAYAKNWDHGAAYIFRSTEDTWVEEVKLQNTAVTTRYFGFSVAISGNTVLIGAHTSTVPRNGGFIDVGAAFVFVDDRGNWVQQEMLTAGDGVYRTKFGISVALSGDTALIGAYEDSLTLDDYRGSAYIFTRNGNTWSQQAKLRASDGLTGDHFGFRVALEDDYALISSYRNGGSTYVFKRNSTWTEQTKLTGDANAVVAQNGYNICLSGNMAIVQTTGGQVIAFSRAEDSWTYEVTFSGNSTASGIGFGSSIASDGTTVLVGAYLDSSPANALYDEREYHGSLYVFRLSQPEPDISIKGNGVNIVDGDDTPAFNDHTDFGAMNIQGNSLTRTFTITNSGTANLLLTENPQVSISGSAAFTVTQQPVSGDLSVGSSQVFQIKFDPETVGSHSATVQIATNDPDESFFDFIIQGIGVIAPEIDVSTTPLAFGTVNIGSSNTLSLIVRNLGNADLNFTKNISGAYSSEFSLDITPVTLSPSEQIFLIVTYKPTLTGYYSAVLSLASNDDNESNINVTLNGTGRRAPEISVESPVNTPLIDNSSTLDFEHINLGESSQKHVVIKNIGSSNLSGLNLWTSGDHSEDYGTEVLESNILPPGGSATFAVNFHPSAEGTRTATLHISSNDSDENPFDIFLTGTGRIALGPVFTVHPQSQLVLLGQPVNFSPTVTGDPVITYRWKKGTTFITNATSSSYGIAVTKAADAAAYSVVADNPVGDPVSSNPAYLGLVTLNQGAQVLKIGGTLKLTCTVTAPKVAGVTVKYDWFRQGSVEPITNGTKANGAIVSGATTGALSIAKIGLADADIYTCRVTLDTPGNDPTLTNGETSVTVVDAVPVMNPIPLPVTASISESIDVTVSASNLPISYSVVGLPKGLSMNTKTGRITGRPSVASKKNTEGDYIPQKITFKAKNVLNEGPGLDFYMVIEALDADVVGTFSGVVGRSSHSNFGMGGLVQITVGSTGAVSGSATLAGQKHKVVGMIDGDLEDTPEASLLIKRSPSSLGDLEMTIRIDGGTRVMSGSIRDPRFQVLQGTLDLGNSAEPDLINGSMSEARFRSPRGIALLPSGSGYIADSGNHVIRFVDTTAGAVTTLAGSGSAGAADGTGSAASFSSPEGLALDKLGNLYVADVGNATIRKITPAGVVTTFAGSAGQTGSTNGTGSAARFSQPCALCFDTAGNLYVADRGNHLIRKVTPAGVVTTLAGKANTAEHKDGSGLLANFNTPRGITYDPVLKALFVTDSLNRVIRKVTLTGKVTTYAGAAKTEGAAEGLFANTRFIEPLGIASLGDGTLIVTDTLLVQLNRNGTSGIISERLDAEDGSDHPAAVAQNPADKTIIAVHDTLHSIASYNSAEEETGLEAPFEARRSLGTVPAAEQGLYNAALITTAQASDVSYPQGSGYAQLSLGKTGIVNWAGKAADGSTLTFGTTVAENRSVPLHVVMYGKTGSLQGRCLINVTTHDIISDSSFPMDWSKIPQPIKSTSRSYKNGFMLHALSLKGGKYTPNNLHSYLGLSSSPADMMLNFAETVNPAFTQTFTLTAPNSLSLVTPAKSLTLKIDPKTGIFTGSFKEGTPAVTVPFAGILIDREASVDQSGYGHYLIPESSAATAPILSAPVSIRAGDEP